MSRGKNLEEGHCFTMFHWIYIPKSGQAGLVRFPQTDLPRSCSTCWHRGHPATRHLPRCRVSTANSLSSFCCLEGKIEGQTAHVSLVGLAVQDPNGSLKLDKDDGDRRMEQSRRWTFRVKCCFIMLHVSHFFFYLSKCN